MVTLQNRLAPQTGLKESTSEEQLDHVLKRLRHSLPKDAGSLRFMRDMKVFDGGQDLHPQAPVASLLDEDFGDE